MADIIFIFEVKNDSGTVILQTGLLRKKMAFLVKGECVILV
jgi:hypothetical protein